VSDQPVLLDVADGVATITLNRPDSKNRLDLDMMTQLTDHVRAAADDPNVRVVVITGTGSTFCAGANLAADGLSGTGPQLLVDALTALLDCPKPVIARVQGHVAGGGNGLSPHATWPWLLPMPGSHSLRSALGLLLQL
jgi:enoyl-CoA hydratase/carnithine racemase